jgi:mono/diheme cytochrome c family protein
MRAHLVLLVTLALTAGCGRHPEPGPASDTVVHRLALPDIPPPELPEAPGPGRAMLQGACSTCHTLRYVLEQPPLTRKQWTAEVDKMRRSYGAPFPDDMSGPIIDYLVATRGNDVPE